MTRFEGITLKAVIEKEYANLFMEEREELHKMAKQQMAIVQKKNIATFNKKRQTAAEYKVGDLVAIRRIQFHNLLKLLPFLRPYNVAKSIGPDNTH
ncbi:hypothetical protein QE152_g19101 [Popillia japonica]|uniref:Uncharacterized protein n=1 Tax=Popillia japonica TaxID=7064 RepID=A0AAW1KYE4_POPJA